MPGNPGPRPSTPSLPGSLRLGTTSRRGSISSINSRYQIDKDAVASALDEIHSSASQSAALTTFNDFGPPPSSSPASDDHSSTSQRVQQGIGNFYSRLRGTKAANGDKQETSNVRQSQERLPPKSPSSQSQGGLNTAFKTSPISTRVKANSETTTLSSFSIEEPLDISSATVPPPDSTAAADGEQSFARNKSQNAPEGRGTVRVRSEASSPISTTRDGHKAQRRPEEVRRAGPDLVEPNPSVRVSDSNGHAVSKSPRSPAFTPAEKNPVTEPFESSASDSKSLHRLAEQDKSERTSSQHRREDHGLAPLLSISSITAPGSRSGTQSPALSAVDSLLAPPRPDELRRNPSQSSAVLHEMRRKVLSRDFWMKDENAKVCFRCGDQFSTFRRKHHCRTCGQIYDSKCTVLTSGKPFGQASKLRVCKTCEAILNGDDSSDYSEDDAASISHVKQIRFSEGPEEIVPGTPLSGSTTSVFRKAQEAKRRPGSSEGVPTLARPSSSRSLKSLSGRPRSSSHRHRRMMHQHMRVLGMPSETGVPFQPSGTGHGATEPFHADSIIDPELAPYVSDDGSSEDENASLAAQLSSSGPENNLGGFASLVGVGRKARHRASRSNIDLSQISRDADNASLASTRAGHKRRAVGSRTLSSGSLVGLNGSSPRIVRSQNLMADYGSRVSMLRRGSVPETDPVQSTSEIEASHLPTNDPFGDRTPAVAELNNASLDHVKLLLRQFLREVNISNAKRWEKTLIPILLRCAEEVDPNINRGDDIDIRHYVKLKKAPGGLPKDSTYVSGVVFTQNLALRSMPRKVHQPRILLVSFPVVYDRHQQHFMSLEPVIAQEREYLRNLTNRIKALKPSVVFVQRQVAGLAIQFLEEANIAVAFNVKESVLQAISRCTQTRIISSVDRLTMDPDHLGRCQKFEVRTFVEEDFKKSYIFVAGCQRDLGCTIMLRGADRKTLRNLKWITEFMCFAVYNLKLETCLMRDEFISIPSTRSAYQDILSSRSSVPPAAKAFCQQLVNELETRILSVSPFVKLKEPFLLLRGREQEQQLERLKELLDDDSVQNVFDSEKTPPKFEMIKHEMLFDASVSASPQLQAAIRAIHEAEYDRVSHHYQSLKRRWEAYVAGAIDPFNPLSHQQIIVLFSIVSTPSGDACEGPDLLGLDFYQEHDVDNNLEPDVPLGEYIERLCHQGTYPCTAQRCDKSMLDHHRQYVHGDGQTIISLHKMPSKMRGMENTILMWSSCLVCDAETQVVPMSRNTWKYSFGKYLELSFWSEHMHARAGLCPHDMHKEHSRFFGFKGMAVCIRYEPINILEVLVPRATVAWKVDKDISLKNEQYLGIEDRMSRFLASVKARIRSIKIESVEVEKSEACKTEIASMLKRVGEEQDFLKNKLQEKYMTSKHYEIIPLNRAVRAMQEKVAEWDTTFADFEHNYFPSETDIRKLAAAQLRRVYLEATGEDVIEAVDEGEALLDVEGVRDGQLSEKQALLADEELESAAEAGLKATPAKDEVLDDNQALTKNVEQLRDLDAVQRLDLAVSTSPSENMEGGQTGTDLRSPEPLQDQPAPSPRSGSPVGQRTKSVGNSLQFSTKAGRPVPPPLLRSKTSPSVPAASPVREGFTDESNAVGQASPRSIRLKGAATNFGLDKKQTGGRLAMAAALRTGKTAMHSMIPRSVPSKRNDSKVSALAKHFEQMSREFEKARLRERQQRAARDRQARVYPMSSYRPVVEVFRDATEAARERDVSIHDYIATTDGEAGHSKSKEEATPETKSPTQSMRTSVDRSSDAEPSDAATLVHSYEASEVDLAISEKDPSVSGEARTDSKTDEDSSMPEQLELPIDLPKHDRSSLMKMLTSFWSERSASGWNALEYPLTASDHIFADSDVVVREDEPSSLIAFALASQDYCSKLWRFRERAQQAEFEQRDAKGQEKRKSGQDFSMERTLLGTTATHMKYQFQAESARMQCKIFFAESFDAIRRKTGVAERFVESLSRCNKWDSKGGKSRSIFLKTMDERFVIKSLSPVETQAFLRFAPDYFDYMSKCLFHNLPSCLAKMLGFYQVVIKNPLTGIEFSYFLQVMENVFYENPSNRLFDLKGSMRNRRIESTGEKDEVLLDENMLDYISQSPVYVRNHSNSLLTSSITNDTLFCSKQNVMDYSLIVGLYDDRKELMVGIIDYIRTYTWDKKLESWIKDRGKHRATVRSPREYRNRFRASIPKYFPLAPSSWQVFGGAQQQTLAPMPMQLLAEGDEGDVEGYGQDGDGEDDSDGT